jgi:hypothetical protein
MSSLYVLKCEEDRYYVGTTSNLDQRLAEHFSGQGSEWTKQYAPLSIVLTRPVTGTHDENNTTKDYMSRYGIHRVRGGAYAQLHLPAVTVSMLRRELQSTESACYTCGESDHIAKDCSAYYNCYDCGKRFSTTRELYGHREYQCRESSRYQDAHDMHLDRGRGKKWD